MIRIVLVEDHVLMREGLKQLFDHVDDIDIVAETANSLELMNLLFENKYDLILLDISMPGVDSFELAQRISQYPQHPPILVLSMHHELQTAQRMFKLGVKGYITKSSNSEELISAIRKVAKGGKYVGSQLSEHLFFETPQPTKNLVHTQLTKRQLAILKLLVKGKKVTEIAESLNLSVKTVSTHKVNMKQKMNIKNDVELIRYALMNEL